MNKNHASKISINSISDLNELQLAHIDIFDHYVNKSTCAVSSWWSQFPNFYGQKFKKGRKPYWIILNNLFVPFLLNNGRLSLLFLPFGEGAPDDYVNVLITCTRFCNKFNEYKSAGILAKWLNDDQLDFLQKSKRFNSIFSYQEHKVGPEYHYNIQNLINLGGKDYSYIRRKINKLKNTHESILVRDYDNVDYNDIVKLNDSWSESANLRYSSLFDKNYYPEIIKYHNSLNHIILVAIDNNKVIGMISGETRNKVGYCLFRKVLEGYDGLSEFLINQLAAKFFMLNPNIEIFNDGGAGKTEGLHFFKERFRPINKPKRYRLRQGFRVLSATAFEGPSIISLLSSARVVVEGTSNLLEEIQKDDVATFEKAIVEILGDDLRITALQLESKPILMIAQVMALIQRASRHEVKHYGYHVISDNKYEIIFEIIRSSMLPRLVHCIRILHDFILFGDNAEELQRFYSDNRQRFAFTLAEYIAHERKQTARRFGIGCYDDSGLYAWIGEGKHSKLLSYGYSEKTTAIGCHVARDKLKSLDYIKRAGAPVPWQINVRDKNSLQKIAPTVSFPVVLKPRGGSKGKGVKVNIRSPQELVDSYKNSPYAGAPMVIQEHIEGHEFRLLVIDAQFIAAVRRIPAFVEGNGLHSINQLIEIKNKIERRDGLYLMPIKIDHDLQQLLRKQGLSLDSVLKQNQKIQIRDVSNVSLGGITQDCTDRVHPDNKAAAVIAAKSCLLDVAGIDFISNDISKSWKEGSGKIIEINNKPGIDLHMLPTRGKKREITKHFLKPFLSATGRIPKIVVTGFKGKKHDCRKMLFSFKADGL